MNGRSAPGEEFQVAIVEDESDLAGLYEVILARMGVPVSFVATSGTEAVVKFTASDPKPRIMLMDNRLPSMSGIKATKVILGMAPDTRIILVSADIGAHAEAIRAGAALFIGKPARISDIIRAIASASDGTSAVQLLPRPGVADQTIAGKA